MFGIFKGFGSKKKSKVQHGLASLDKANKLKTDLAKINLLIKAIHSNCEIRFSDTAAIGSSSDTNYPDIRKRMIYALDKELRLLEKEKQEAFEDIVIKKKI